MISWYYDDERMPLKMIMIRKGMMIMVKVFRYYISPNTRIRDVHTRKVGVKLIYGFTDFTLCR